MTQGGCRLDDGGRKWVYYRLTRKAERILNRRATRSVLPLALASLAALAASAAAFWQHLQGRSSEEPPSSGPSFEPGLDTGGGEGGGAGAPDPSGIPFLSEVPDPWLLALAVGLLALAAALAAAAWRVRNRVKRCPPRKAEG